MKYLIKATVVVAFLLFFMTTVVLAVDYITEAVQALKVAPVYVALGVEGTDNYTAGKLQSMLREGDSIVLVMLPKEALADTDILTLVTSLSNELNDRYIIGLAVGEEVVGYAPMLPTGVGADQMKRADSVSNDPITALITFVQNIHTWQAKNHQPTITPSSTPSPQPTPTKTPRPVSQEKKPLGIFWIPIVFGILLIFGGVFLRLRKMGMLSKRVLALKPTELLILELRSKVSKIRDIRVREDLSDACLIAEGLLEVLQRAQTHQGYVEEKFPELVRNLDIQVTALLGHESRRYPLSDDTLSKLKEVLLNYDDLFIQLQSGNERATELLATIIDSSNAMIASMGYLPEDK